MRWVIFLLIALLPSAGQTGAYRDLDGTWWDQVDPPAHFRSGTYLAPPKIRFLPREKTFEVCLAATRITTLGCAEIYADACRVTIADDLPPTFLKAVVEHELAHCRGWPGNHPLGPIPGRPTPVAVEPYATGWPRVVAPGVVVEGAPSLAVTPGWAPVTISE